jgi:hypothetical protein
VANKFIDNNGYYTEGGSQRLVSLVPSGSKGQPTVTGVGGTWKRGTSGSSSSLPKIGPSGAVVHRKAK